MKNISTPKQTDALKFYRVTSERHLRLNELLKEKFESKEKQNKTAYTITAEDKVDGITNKNNKQ
jgi:hypothetical protein